MTTPWLPHFDSCFIVHVIEEVYEPYSINEPLDSLPPFQHQNPHILNIAIHAARPRFWSGADVEKAQQRPIDRETARTSCSLCARRLPTVFTILRKANAVKPRALHRCLDLRRPNLNAAPPNDKRETAIDTAEATDTLIIIDADMRDAEWVICLVLVVRLTIMVDEGQRMISAEEELEKEVGAGSASGVLNVLIVIF